MTKRRGRSVLCIGNNPVHLNLRCSFLRENGWPVFSSGNGHEAIRQFNKQPADLVILDMNDDGTEAALIAGELKRLRLATKVVLIVPDGKSLVPGASAQADAVLLRSQESTNLLDTLQKLSQNTQPDS